MHSQRLGISEEVISKIFKRNETMKKRVDNSEAEVGVELNFYQRAKEWRGIGRGKDGNGKENGVGQKTQCVQFCLLG